MMKESELSNTLLDYEEQNIIGEPNHEIVAVLCGVSVDGMMSGFHKADYNVAFVSDRADESLIFNGGASVDLDDEQKA
jgi:hypothetical protein